MKYKSVVLKKQQQKTTTTKNKTINLTFYLRLQWLRFFLCVLGEVEGHVEVRCRSDEPHLEVSEQHCCAATLQTTPFKALDRLGGVGKACIILSPC